MSKKILILFFVISLVGFGFFGMKLFQALQTYSRVNEIYNSISEIAYSTSTSDPVRAEIPSDNIQGFNTNTESRAAEIITERSLTQQQIEMPEPSETNASKGHKSSMNFESLHEINPDIKGWIKLENSKVDYPILQSNDNDFYLHHAVNGEWNKVGTPFIDYRCEGNFSDRITVIYGHYMENGTMFTDLHKYKGQKYFDEHPVINLFTPDGDYDIYPVAGVFQNVEYWDFTLDFYSDEQFLHYIDNWKAVSTFKSDTSYTAEDRFIALTLCTYDIEDGRYILVGKIVSKDS